MKKKVALTIDQQRVPGLTDIWSEIESEVQQIELPARGKLSFDPKTVKHVFVVETGLFKVGRRLSGQREDYQYLARPSEWLGELALLEPDFPPFFAVATQPSRLIQFPILPLRRLMMQYPTFNLQLLQHTTQRMRHVQQRRENMLQQSTRARILHFLCAYCEEFGEPDNQGFVRITYPLNHTDIGKFTATSRQSVNAIMAELRRQEVLDYDQQYIWVPEQLIGNLRHLS